MTQWLAVMGGGAVGSLARFLLAGLVTRWVTPLAVTPFPWGTLAVNVIGAFVMGVLVEMMALKWSLSLELRAFLTVGVLGGFTTFSAFTLETVTMIERGDWTFAFAYIVASVLLCVSALFCGLALVRAALT